MFILDVKPAMSWYESLPIELFPYQEVGGFPIVEEYIVL